MSKLPAKSTVLARHLAAYGISLCVDYCVQQCLNVLQVSEPYLMRKMTK